MAICCARVFNRIDEGTQQHQPQKGTWFAFGVKSVCILTGTTLGAVGEGCALMYLTKFLVEGSLSQGDSRTAIVLALHTPIALTGGIVQGATVGAVAGCCVANRILARFG
jgi:hypothetical protein